MVWLRNRKSILFYTSLNVTVATFKKQEERDAERERKKIQPLLRPSVIVTIDLTVHLPNLLLGNGGVAPSISETWLFCLCRLVRSRASMVVSLEVGLEEASKNLPT